MIGGSGAGSRICRLAMRASYRDTNRGFSAKHRGGASGKGDPTLRAKAPKAKSSSLPRRYDAGVEHGLVGPMLILLLAAAGIIAAVSTLPKNGALVVVFIFICAAALLIGRSVANSKPARTNTIGGKRR